jgi:hypothetical protein
MKLRFLGGEGFICEHIILGNLVWHTCSCSYCKHFRLYWKFILGKAKNYYCFSFGTYGDQNYHVYQDNYCKCGHCRTPSFEKRTFLWNNYGEQRPGLQIRQKLQTQSQTDLVQWGPSTLTPHKSRVGTPGWLLGDMQKHVLAKIVKREYGKNKYPIRQCRVCSVHKRRRHVVHLQVLPSATPQRGMFREISHFEALLGALVFLKNFSS